MVDIPSDAELASRARAGDAPALGALLARHRASMRAVAIRVLGHRRDAEDAVQDAIVTALAHIAELRDPTAAGGWLRAIVRNRCSMTLRQRLPSAPVEALLDFTPDPEETLERHALKAWLLGALDSLSDTLQFTLLLRYFTDVTSYEDIAAFSGVPVGTVRSRLAEAKRKLSEVLMSDAFTQYDDLRERAARRAGEAAQVLAEAEQGRFWRVATEIFDPEVIVVGPDRNWGTDLRFLTHVIDHDREHGVRHVLRHVTSSRGVTIWDMDLVSPASDPTHCPSSIVWAHFTAHGRTRRVRLFHPMP
jgi:RNA polymerase sigma-70 factor (ECF subfamily)